MAYSKRVGLGLFSPSTSKRPHLLNTDGGLAGEINDLRGDLKALAAPLAAIAIEEWTNPTASGAALIKSPVASVASAQHYTSLLAGAALIQPPRPVSATTAGTTPSDAPATATFTGTDIHDAVITEQVTLNQSGGVVYTTKFFKSVTAVDMPAADSTGATIGFGISNVFPLEHTALALAGVAIPVQEITAGVVPSAGTINTAANTYAPNVTADGAKDFALLYVYDPTV